LLICFKKAKNFYKLKLYFDLLASDLSCFSLDFKLYSLQSNLPSYKSMYSKFKNA
jgi:hypothetical protein